MSDVAALIADMVRAGVDPDLIGRAAAAFAQNVQIVQSVQDPVAEKRRAYDRERKAAKKLSTGIPPESEETTGTDLPPKKENTPTPPKEKTTPIPISPLVGARAQFIEFWNLFPNKVGKRDAEREFNLALQRSSFDEIMAGLRRYVDKTDDRPWCNPSTFLHQNRWEDQPVSITRRQNGHSPPERSVSDVLGEMAAGTWTGPKDTTPNEPFIETSFTRRN